MTDTDSGSNFLLGEVISSHIYCNAMRPARSDREVCCPGLCLSIGVVVCPAFDVLQKSSAQLVVLLFVDQ